MGLSLKSIGKGLKKVGKVALKVAPVAAAFIPGVGPLAAAGIGAAAGAIGKGKPKLGNILGGAATGALGGVGKAAMGAGGVAGALKGGVGGALKKAGSFALKNPDLLMAGMSGLQGYQADKRADALRKQQLDLAMQNWNQTAPLRTMGQGMMMDQSLEDLSGISRNRYNPFAV